MKKNLFCLLFIFKSVFIFASEGEVCFKQTTPEKNCWTAIELMPSRNSFIEDLKKDDMCSHIINNVLAIVNKAQGRALFDYETKDVNTYKEFYKYFKC